ncbi:MAG: cytidine deaminase [Firmicutes bacterium]|nr:cytidine deaminase [Bacillota bacterium]
MDAYLDAHIDARRLAFRAAEARANAYAPYSCFLVGAALLTKGGKIYTGCNIENAAFSPTNCAERTAFFKAVSEGERDFTAIAVAGWAQGAQSGRAYPCGVCLQVMAEFCEAESFLVYAVDAAGGIEAFLLKNLMPYGFGKQSATKHRS